jgi:hypothetical protein
MWGSVGGQDVAQKFKLNMKTVATTVPVINSVSPTTITMSDIASGADITITGQNFSSSAGIKVEFRQGNGIIVPAVSFSVTSPTTIKARVPSSFQPGSYFVEVTSGGLVATPQNGDSSK